ncbi:MAG: NAD-dependent epimerase/dehydratase family protein [Planctomycetaceae bacterium]
MQLTDQDLLLITGATGLVGSHLAEEARQRGLRTRAIVRASSDTKLLDEWGVETVVGDMADPLSLAQALAGATVVVHCAAKVGDWGPIDEYRQVNVAGLEKLLEAAEANGSLRRFVHVSSLGVYEARDHHGTDETEPVNLAGIDGYTVTKAEADLLVQKHVAEKNLPGVILRPGFIYGPRDRTVFPRLLERIRDKRFAYLGKGDKLVNNTYVGNLVQAIFLAIEKDEALGRVFNIRDGRLVTKKEFMEAIADEAGYDKPTKHVNLQFAKGLAKVMEGTWRLLGKKEAPLLSSARIKFLGLNLDFSMERAQRELGYQPATDFDAAMKTTIDWFREQGML